MRSSTPGEVPPVASLISAVRTLAFGSCVELIERLLWLSMVKYRLSNWGVLQLAARDVADAGTLDLITSAPNQAAIACRSDPTGRGEIENANALERLCHRLCSYSLCPVTAGRMGVKVCLLLLQNACGLRLPMRPLGAAAGSITALISVGLPEIHRFVDGALEFVASTLTPVPPKASITCRTRALDEHSRRRIAPTALTSVPRKCRHC